MKLDRLYKQSSQYSVSTQIKHQQYARRLSHKPNECRCQCGKKDEKMGNDSSAHVYIMTYYQDGKHKKHERYKQCFMYSYSTIYIQNRWLSHWFTIYTNSEFHTEERVSENECTAHSSTLLDATNVLKNENRMKSNPSHLNQNESKHFCYCDQKNCFNRFIFLKGSWRFYYCFNMFFEVDL